MSNVVNTVTRIDKTITGQYHFDAAHHLPGYNGPCANLHGHRWLVETTFNQPALPEDEKKVLFEELGFNYYEGIAIDFKDIKKVVNNLCDALDHSCINDTMEEGVSPTAENICDILTIAISDSPLGRWLKTVKVFETPTNYVTNTLVREDEV